MDFRQVADGLDSPLGIASTPSEPDRLYVVEQPGLVRVVENGKLLPQPFLDITTRSSAAASRACSRSPSIPTTGPPGSSTSTTRTRTATRASSSSGPAAAPPSSGASFSSSTSRTRTTTAASLRSGRTGGSTSGWATAARAAIPRTARRTWTRSSASCSRSTSTRTCVKRTGDRGLRSSQPVALLVRPRDRRPLDRRRRPGESGRRSTTRRATSPGLENYGWDVYEGDTRLRGQGPEPGRHLVMPVSSTATMRVAR